MKTFLPSVTETDYPDFEIIIANNASSDASKEWVQDHYPDIRIVTFSENFGYCGGNNRASDYATGEIIVFLNNDVKVDPDWLKNLDKAFDRNKVAAAQPKLRACSDPDFFEYAGAAGGYLDYYGYPFCRGRIFDTVEKDNGQYDTPEEILWASGAALAIRKNVFYTMGKFDEDFEFHMEEIDLCWRLWNRGFEVVCEPASVVYHLGGGSLPMGSTRKIYYNYRNNLIMMIKNLPEKKVFLRILARLCLDGLSGLRSLLKLKPLETTAIIRAHFAFYGQLFNSLKKREELQETRVISGDPDIMFNKSIISEYYLFKKKTYMEIMTEES